MINLPHNCSCSEPSIFPSNWNEAGASLKVKWKVQFYFYDPGNPDPKKRKKFCPLKGGVNKFKTLQERRTAISILLDETLIALKQEGWNPITGEFTKATPPGELGPDTPFFDALRGALKNLSHVKTTIKNIQGSLNRMERAAVALRINNYSVSMIGRKNIRAILDECGRQVDEKNVPLPWTACTFNHYRSYLIMLFNELIEIEVVENDPVSKIKKKKETKKFRKTLTAEQRTMIDNHLQEVDPYFRRLVNIFFHSGCRTLELLNIKKTDVFLEEGYFIVTVKKNSEVTQEARPIKDIAFPFWEEAYNQSQSQGKEFIFGPNFMPGDKACSRDHATRKWEKYVKNDLGIDIDMYALKHLNLDEVAAQLDIKHAQNLAGHKSGETTKLYYAFGEKAREAGRIKTVSNPFGGGHLKAV